MSVVNFLNFKTFFCNHLWTTTQVASWILFFPLYNTGRQQLTHQVEGEASTSDPNLEEREELMYLRLVLLLIPASLHTIPHVPKPSYQQDKRNRNNRLPQCTWAWMLLLQWSLCKGELAQGHVPILHPPRRGCWQVYEMLSIPKDCQLTVFKFNVLLPIILILGRILSCCKRRAHMFIHVHRSTHWFELSVAPRVILYCCFSSYWIDLVCVEHSGLKQ